MKLWVDRINTFLKYKDLLFQLVSRDIKLEIPEKFSGLFVERIESIICHDYYDDCVFNDVQPKYPELPGIFIYRKNAV